MEKLPAKIEKSDNGLIFPDVKREHGEIERVAQKYMSKDQEGFVNVFYERAKKSTLVDLTEDMWSVLDNTDSFDIPNGGWEEVAVHIDYTNQETGASRSWKDLKNKIECGQDLDAPIILKYVGKMHLVSGNTRLMVARALGRTPKVLVVEI